MYCTTPNVVKLDYTHRTEKNKPSVKFYGGKKWTNAYKWEDIPYLNKMAASLGNDIQYMRVPCGQCRICRIKKNFEWVARMQLEALSHKNAYFITLTYDDEHLPIIPYYEAGDKIYINTTNQGSLNPRDLELFWKRLRKNWGLKNLRYYAAGEYGTTRTNRPHYHAIVYDLDIIESELIRVPHKKEIFYHEGLAEIWGKGFVSIRRIAEGNVNDPNYQLKLNTTALMYTASYILKKRNGEKHWVKDYLEKGKYVKEFQRCSTGLGKAYYLEHKDIIYQVDGKVVTNDKISNSDARVQIQKIAYFDRKMAEENPDIMNLIKQHRQQLAEEEEKTRLAKTTLTLAEQFEIDRKTFDIRLNQSFESKMKRKHKENSLYDPERERGS